MNSSETQCRQAHATQDLPSRIWKGLKIERLLYPSRHNEQCPCEMHSTPIEILDVGTGSGGIAHYFASHPDLKCNVASVDTTDNRKIFDGFDFQQVSDTHLPFPDESFDVVLSNHVIEHVGKIAEQKHHLSELKRVLRRDGMIYLAVPNRWMLVEPHYQLAFLSCLPTPWRTPYLRWRGKGNFYDCEPLSLKQLQQFLEEGQFNYRNVSVEAMRRFFDIEKPHSIACKLLRQCPDVLLTPLRSLIPTLVYILTKPR